MSLFTKSFAAACCTLFAMNANATQIRIDFTGNISSYRNLATNLQGEYVGSSFKGSLTIDPGARPYRYTDSYSEKRADAASDGGCAKYTNGVCSSRIGPAQASLVTEFTFSSGFGTYVIKPDSTGAIRSQSKLMYIEYLESNGKPFQTLAMELGVQESHETAAGRDSDSTNDFSFVRMGFGEAGNQLFGDVKNPGVPALHAAPYGTLSFNDYMYDFFCRANAQTGYSCGSRYSAADGLDFNMEGILTGIAISVLEEPAKVPEPAPLALALAGLLGLAASRRARRG